MSSPDIILHEYATILKGQSTQIIKSSQENLLQLEKAPNFVQDNSLILCSPQITISIKKFAALYLTKYSKRLIKEKSLQKCLQAITNYMQLLGDNSLQFDIKPIIVNSIQILLNFETNRATKLQLAHQYISVIKQSVNLGSQIDQVSIVFFGQALIGGKDNYAEITKQIIKSTIVDLVKIGMQLNQLVAQTCFENRQNLIHMYIQQIYRWRLLKEFSILLRLYIKKLPILGIESMKPLYEPALQLLITTSLQFNYKQNQVNSTIYFIVSNDDLISKTINITKANYVSILSNIIKTLHSYAKHPSLLQTNPVYTKMPQLLEYFIKSTSNLFNFKPYFELPSKIMLLETVDETLNIFLDSMRVHDFYQVFTSNKTQIIENIIISCLALTKKDVEDFYEDSQEFIFHIIQITTRNIKVPHFPHLSNSQPEEQLQQYQTLKTLSAELLNTLCKFQDGTLSHIFELAIGIIQGKIKGISKSLALLLISILSHQLKDRNDLKIRVSSLIIHLIDNCAIPIVGKVKKEEDVDYAFLLLALSKIFPYVIEANPQIINKIYKVGCAVIQSSTTNQVHKYFALQTFDHLAKKEQTGPFCLEIINLFNFLLKNIQQPSFHLLDSYYLLIQQHFYIFKNNTAQIIEGVNIMSNHIQRQIQKAYPTKLFLSKCWNIIRLVGESQYFVPKLIVQIETAILPLIQYINDSNNFDNEQDLLLLLTSFLEKGKRVSNIQQKIFEIIPTIFYNEYCGRFGQSFRAINLFIYYGSDLLKSNINAIQVIIDMCIISISSQYKKKSLGQNQNSQGVMILQSLVLKCSQSFTVDMWTSIIKTIINKLQQNIRFYFLSSNLYALLSLILVHSHKLYSDEENDLLLAKALSNVRVFSRAQYSAKVYIAGMMQLLLYSSWPFVAKRFCFILDIVITLLQIISKKVHQFGEEKNQEACYENSLFMLHNDLKIMDEFCYFRLKIQELKITSLDLLKNSVNELPKPKKQFFSHVLMVERVQDEPRQIYKIKR